MQGTSASGVTMKRFVSSNVFKLLRKKIDADESILDRKLYPVPKFMDQEHCYSFTVMKTGCI